MSTNFGREMSCTDSLRTGRFVIGPRLVAEACYRRLTTPRGMLRGGEQEADYGLDLSELVGSTNTKGVAASLPGRIRSELTKDERVVSVDVVVSQATDTAGRITFTIAIDAETTEGPFTLVVSVDAVTVQLLGITTEAA